MFKSKGAGKMKLMNLLFLINLGLRFILEVVTIILLIGIGFAKNKFPINILIGILLPLLIIVVWSIFVAPSSQNRASSLVRISIEILVYMSVASVLLDNYSLKIAISYLGFAILNSVVNFIRDH